MVSLKERLASFMAITIMNRIFIRHSSNVTLFSPLYEFFPASRNKIDRIIRTRSFEKCKLVHIQANPGDHKLVRSSGCLEYDNNIRPVSILPISIYSHNQNTFYLSV